MSTVWLIPAFPLLGALLNMVFGRFTGRRAKVVMRERIDIAVVAVPAESAQSVVNIAVQAGIRAILNFSPGALKVPPGVKLKHVDLTVSLESLSFFLARGHAEAQ